MAVSLDEDNMIVKEIVEVKDSNGNISSTYEYKTLNKNMNADKNYAMVTVDKDGNMFVRNFFDSKHPKGFDQKNTYFSDKNADKFMLSDENNVLLNYIKLGYPDLTTIKNIDNHGFLYFCVEYKINDGLNPNLLNYCILLDNKMLEMENRLKNVEEKIKINEDNKVVDKQSSIISNIRFRFF
jgi:hypothetical protein